MAHNCKGRLAAGSCWQGARERTMNGMLRLRCCAAIFLQPARRYECAMTAEVPLEACVARRQRLYSGAKPPLVTEGPSMPAKKVSRQDMREAAEKYKNWGKWGPDDEIGTLNYTSAED